MNVGRLQAEVVVRGNLRRQLLFAVDAKRCIFDRSLGGAAAMLTGESAGVNDRVLIITSVDSIGQAKRMARAGPTGSERTPLGLLAEAARRPWGTTRIGARW